MRSSRRVEEGLRHKLVGSCIRNAAGTELPSGTVHQVGGGLLIDLVLVGPVIHGLQGSRRDLQEADPVVMSRHVEGVRVVKGPADLQGRVDR